MAGKFAVLVLVLSAATISACTYDLKIDANGFTCTTASDCPSGYRCENSTSQHPGVCCNLPDSRSCLPPTGSDASIDVASNGGQGDASLSSGGTGGLRVDGGGTSDVPIGNGGATGGRAGTGGITGSGGLTGSGGIASSGGRAGAGGTMGSGGLTVSGGTTGGVAGTGGIVRTGGAVGTGGTIVPGLAVFAGIPSCVGSVDGTGAAASFYAPSGVAVDGAGNVFVADQGNATIRKITPAGAVTTLAGRAGSSGSADGTGTAARFYHPSAVAVDGAGNVFVADTWNHTIRKITPTGVVTTLAGTAGSSGSADGTGAAAHFYDPYGVAVDGAGNLFVADTWNHTIRMITPTGMVTTLAGTAGLSGSANGTGAAARFNKPYGVAVDGAGNLFVADNGNYTIRKITPAGVVTTLAGTPGSSGSADGTAAAARFNGSLGVAVDGAGNVFVADFDNNTIRKITPAGVVTTLAGTPGSSGGADGGSAVGFSGPFGVAVDGAGNVFVADSGNNTIRKITPAGVVTTLAGAASSGSADGTGAAARFNSPEGVAVDGAGNVFVADSGNNTIRKITPAGVVTTLAGAGSSGSADGIGAAALFNSPQGVAVDGAGNVFVGDYHNNIIRKITPAGVATTLAGTAGSSGSANGTGAAARFWWPSGVAVDGAGNLFVADTDNNTIRKITPAGVVSTLAGTAGSSGSADGTSAAARFYLPTGVAVDGAGNVFVADFNNHTIRKITPAGVVTTLAGSAGMSGSADGAGTAARFYHPHEVAVDGVGNVFVADRDNNTIRKITTSGVVTTIVGVAAPVSTGNFPGPLPASIVSPVGVAIDPSTGNLYITLQDAVMVAVLPN